MDERGYFSLVVLKFKDTAGVPVVPAHLGQLRQWGCPLPFLKASASSQWVVGSSPVFLLGLFELCGLICLTSGGSKQWVVSTHRARKIIEYLVSAYFTITLVSHSSSRDFLFPKELSK